MNNRKIIVGCWLMLGLLFAPAHASAQTRQALRDSLSKAVDQLAYHPDSLDLRLKKAAWNLQLEQWQYAKDEYDYVLQREPSNPAGLYFRAFANRQLHRYGFARLDYENLLTVVPGHFEGLLGLALLNQQDRRYTEAMNQINLLVNQHPDSATAYAARAGMERERNLLEVAEFDYGEAIRRAPSNTDFILNRAEVRIMLRKYNEAREDLDRLVGLGVPRAEVADWYRKIKKKRR